MYTVFAWFIIHYIVIGLSTSDQITNRRERIGMWHSFDTQKFPEFPEYRQIVIDYWRWICAFWNVPDCWKGNVIHTNLLWSLREFTKHDFWFGAQAHLHSKIGRTSIGGNGNEFTLYGRPKSALRMIWKKQRNCHLTSSHTILIHFTALSQKYWRIHST